ncbi:LysR family transcriptional regulator [Paenibacillaceae bacterium]|nr:LysR family transcriptional regulator [Paenibacillaceae bacterium]
MFNLEWYRIFLQTARTGNLTRAAEALYITQPSVSYALKQMEEALGVKLFHRLSKGVKLTAEGQVLLDYVEQSFALLEAGEHKLDALKRLLGGEIRIGASDSLIKHLLLPQLNEFHLAHPDIRIRLSHGKTADIVHRLKEGGIDCGFVHLPVDDPLLDIMPLTALQDCFVAGKAYASMAANPLSPEELSKLPLLMLSADSSTRHFIEHWFAAHGLTANEPDIELGSIDLLAEFAKLGFGIAFITRSFVEKELAAGELFELPTAAPIPPRTIGIATRHSMGLSLAAERFIGMLHKAFAPV